MRFSDLIGKLTSTIAMRDVENTIPEISSSENLDEANWIDLSTPCQICGHTFSFNYVTGESRE
jgi:hypothetical protein